MTETTPLRELRARAQRRYRDREVDLSAILACPAHVHYGDARRVIVRSTYPDGATHTRAGRIDATTGWRPALLLVSSERALGSSDVLGPNDHIVAVQTARGYYPARVGPHGVTPDLNAPRVPAPRGQVYTEPSRPGEDH